MRVPVWCELEDSSGKSECSSVSGEFSSLVFNKQRGRITLEGAYSTCGFRSAAECLQPGRSSAARCARRDRHGQLWITEACARFGSTQPIA